MTDNKNPEYVKNYFKTVRPSVWSGTDMLQYFTLTIDEGVKKLEEVRKPEPNGIDLTVDKVFFQSGNPVLTQRKVSTSLGMLEEMTVYPVAGIDDRGWVLRGGDTYVIEWSETVQIPDSAIGLIFPRSTLLRMGHLLMGAVWDSGYYGKGRSVIYISQAGLLLERGSRMAQMIFIEADKPAETYAGQYQYENLVGSESYDKKED